MIEKKIKDSFENYEIKTKSNLILARYNESLKPKKVFSKTLLYRACFSLSILLIAVIVIVVTLNNNNRPNIETPKVSETGHTNGLKDDSVFGEFSMQLYYGCMVSTKEASRNIRYKKSYTLSDFESAVNDIDSKLSLIDMLYINKDGLDYTYKTTEYVYNNETYYYEFSVEGFIMYTKKDITKKENQKMVLVIDSNIYEGNIKYETEEDEVEMKLMYKIGNETIKIEKEYENSEFSYKYQRLSGNTLIEMIKLEIENEEELEISLKHYVNEVTTNISIEYDEVYLIDYVKENISFKGIEVDITNNITTYKYEEFEIKK